MSSDFKNSGDELLVSFHKQFAENQNHHQKLLVTMVSAVAIVLVGYSTVYVNTTTQANLWDLIRDKDTHIISYSLMTLIYVSAFAQFILCLLGLMNLNIGYGFRRDQKIIKNIRVKLLGTRYKSIFGEKGPFNPESKKINEYLPGFNYTFQISLVALQILLMYTITDAVFYSKHFTENIKYFLICLLALPVIASIFFFILYFKKYEKMIAGFAPKKSDGQL